MNNKDFKISIIIPLYNEEKTIIQLLKKIIKFIRINYEIIIVNDGSTDLSLKYIKKFSKNKKKIKVISHKKNLGKGAAIATAKKYLSGNIVLIQDADLEYDPKDYTKLISPIVNKKADVVYGTRFSGIGERKVHFFWNTIANKILTFLCNLRCNLNLTDMEVGYKAFKSEIFRKINLQENRFGFEPEVTIKLSKFNLRFYEVGINYYGRNYKEGKKINIYDALAALKILIFKYYF